MMTLKSIGKIGGFFGLCLLLAACSGEQEPSAEMNAADAQMLKLQIMIVNAVQMTTNDDPVSALRVLRRAMSGPEMNAMHHGGKIHPVMKQLHDLGDALFSVLDEKAVSKADFVWQSMLVRASKDAQVRLMGRVKAGGEGVKNANTMQQNNALPSDTAYAKAVRLLIQRLRLL